MVVLGTIRSFLEPFCGHLSPKIDKFSEELTLRYPHLARWGSCVHTAGYEEIFGPKVVTKEMPEFPSPYL